MCCKDGNGKPNNDFILNIMKPKVVPSKESLKMAGKLKIQRRTRSNSLVTSTPIL